MYEGDRLSKKETSILPKTCKFLDVRSLNDSFAQEGEYASTTDFSSMLVKTTLDNPNYANIPGSIKCN